MKITLIISLLFILIGADESMCASFTKKYQEVQRSLGKEVSLSATIDKVDYLIVMNNYIAKNCKNKEDAIEMKDTLSDYSNTLLGK